VAFPRRTAPGQGPPGVNWYLTTRDRRAKNLGWSLRPDAPDPDFDIDALDDPTTSPPCTEPASLVTSRSAAPPPAHDFVRGLESGWFEDLGYEIGDWLPGT